MVLCNFITFRIDNLLLNLLLIAFESTPDLDFNSEFLSAGSSIKLALNEYCFEIPVEF